MSKIVQPNECPACFKHNRDKMKLEAMNKILDKKIMADIEKNSEKQAHHEKVIHDLKLEAFKLRAKNNALKSKLEVYENMWSKVGIAYFEMDKAINNGKFLIT